MAIGRTPSVRPGGTGTLEPVLRGQVPSVCRGDRYRSAELGTGSLSSSRGQVPSVWPSAGHPRFGLGGQVPSSRSCGDRYPRFAAGTGTVRPSWGQVALVRSRGQVPSVWPSGGHPRFGPGEQAPSNRSCGDRYPWFAAADRYPSAAPGTGTLGSWRGDRYPRFGPWGRPPSASAQGAGTLEPVLGGDRYPRFAAETGTVQPSWGRVALVRRGDRYPRFGHRAGTLGSARGAGTLEPVLRGQVPSVCRGGRYPLAAPGTGTLGLPREPLTFGRVGDRHPRSIPGTGTLGLGVRAGSVRDRDRHLRSVARTGALSQVRAQARWLAHGTDSPGTGYPKGKLADMTK
ncbi:MAG: hypothetical protein KatS3mg109_0871 [Pirellulaceae bacterium]|nr:MAG: hypothetical protein KatS3mg109_0871 [Pirellulaceae bacterium]